MVLLALRDAITDDSVRINACIAAFISRALRMMLHPDHLPMYPLIGKVCGRA